MAPVLAAAVVPVSALWSFVSTVQVPLPRLVPSLMLQSDGTPVNVRSIRPVGWPPDGSVSAKLIGSPAIPAGATWKEEFSGSVTDFDADKFAASHAVISRISLFLILVVIVVVIV